MNEFLAGLAAIALVPAMTGVPQDDAPRAISVALCGGGVLSIPIDGETPARGIAPCCAKGCRSSRRKRGIDQAQ